MSKSRFSDEQKVKLLREAEASSVAEVARKHGLARETIYAWRRTYNGMGLSESLGEASCCSFFRPAPVGQQSS